VFRRRSSDAPEVLEVDLAAPDGSAADAPGNRARPGLTPPKGVPTPKRSAAQANRRQPYQAPADRKAASRRSRDRNRTERARRSEAYQRGEAWAMPLKDKGPVRALARNVVDARRGIGEYYMVLVIVLVILLVVPGTTTKYIFDAAVIGMVVLMLAEGWFVGTKVKRLAAQRYPGESTRGLMLYTIMRGIQVRRLRMPKPAVKRGEKV
jgi:Protein of unknown function (DUF3043)